MKDKARRIVYVMTRGSCPEDWATVGVFSTRAQAQAYVDALPSLRGVEVEETRFDPGKQPRRGTKRNARSAIRV